MQHSPLYSPVPHHSDGSRPSLGFPLAANHHSDPAKPKSNYFKQEQMGSLPVIMPGDKIAKFIALPCPCEPPRPEKQAPIPTTEKTPKPPRFPVPLY